MKNAYVSEAVWLTLLKPDEKCSTSSLLSSLTLVPAEA